MNNTRESPANAESTGNSKTDKPAFGTPEPVRTERRHSGSFVRELGFPELNPQANLDQLGRPRD